MRSSIARTLIVPFFIIILLTIHGAAVPPLPAEFYGSISIDGNPAPVGTVISAQINGVEKGQFITISPGFYGGPGVFDSRLKVNVTEEEYRPGEMKIVFIINGGQANQTADYEPGSSKQLDLIIGAGGIALQPSGVITPSGTVAAVQTQNQTGVAPVSTQPAGSTTVTYGLDQPKTFIADDGLAEISFAKDTMLFSPDGQFLTAVGLRSRNVADLPPLPANQSLQFSGYAYEIIPEGTYFNPKGTLTLKLPPDRAYNIISAGPVVYEYLPQTATWEPVNTNSNVFTNLITAEVFEAAIYGLYVPSMAGLGNNSSPTELVSGQIPPVPVIPESNTNQTDIAPIITPQSIITPQDIITPLPTQVDPIVTSTQTPLITPEPPVTQVTQVPETTGGIFSPRIPGLGLAKALASAIVSRLSGPVLAALGVISLIIVANIAVYAAYRYWWLERKKNG